MMKITMEAHNIAAMSYRNQYLIHWGQDKIYVISQMTFSNAYSWMKMYEFGLWYHRSLLKLTIFQHLFR